jgi:N-acetylglutamate synthase-like GNAT family acetyltransferase
LGLSTQLVSELVDLATTGGFERLCAFTHAPSFFVRRDFSIVPHVWLPEKIVTDCHACPHFRHCGQYAVVRELGRARRGHIPQATSRG